MKKIIVIFLGLFIGGFFIGLSLNGYINDPITYWISLIVGIIITLSGILNFFKGAKWS